jgi:serine/threonine protein kinase/Flp pilus assembly protein TadD
LDRELWRKAEELFIQCADLSQTQARAFLDAACSDAELREAVESLLRGDTQGNAIEEAVGRTASSLADAQRDRRIGAQVGVYTVTSRIAEGGMGAVYLASRSDQQFEQQVAIKFLTSTLVTDELRMRFMAERQILANLNHINIAKLFDGGETEDGVPYLVLEYIDGVPLDEYCAVNRLTIDERLSLFLQICSSVEYAHGHLIVHRDIKPSNILVGADGVPKLLDFGIAKILDAQNLPAGAALTMDGSRLLTPRHASPEQILGEQITTASDVYSLGLLLYELLCGRFPYDLDKTTRASEVENTIVRADPLAPSNQVRPAADIDAVCRERRTVRAKLQHKLRGDLDTIVLTALRKEPESRYSSAREFADDLRRAIEHRPILARPPTLPYLASRVWRRHRTAAIGIIATILVTLVGIAATTVGFFKAREAERIAVAESRNAAATSDFLVGLFRASDPEETAGNESSVSDILRLGVERIEADMEDTPMVKASILETLSSVYKARTDYEESALLLERALQILEKHAPDDQIGSARLNNDLGDLYRLLGRYDEATRHLELAYAINRQTANDAGEAEAGVVNNLALIYGLTGRADEVAALLLEALRIRTSVYASPHPRIALSLHNLAWHFNLVGNLAEAERYALQALDMRIALFGEVHPRVVSTMGELSDIYFDQARWKESEAAAARALELAEQIFEPGHRTIAYELYFVARARHVMGDLRGASEFFARAIEYGKVTLGSDHPTVGMRLMSYARCLLDLGQNEQAETALRESRAIFVKHTDGPPARLANVETLLADTLLRSGRLDDARQMLGAESSTGDSPERQLLRARLMLAQGDAAQAEELTVTVLQGLETTAGHHLPLLPEVLHVQGISRIAVGHLEGAVESLEKSLAIYSENWADDYWRAELVRADLGAALARVGDSAGGRLLLVSSAAALEQQLGPDHPETRRALAVLEEFDASN